ncbi:MAG: hypothetical protein AAGF26_00070 [Cyanobacteria bacterium P01_G01_bin.49]
MNQVIVPDAHPLSQITHPRIKPSVQKWLKSLDKETVIKVAEITDYELRRELLRTGKQKSIDRLNKFNQEVGLIPLNSAVMQKAAELWAWTRNKGKPTASNDSLDGDVILVSQAIIQLSNFDKITIATTNIKHISLFKEKGNDVLDWEETLKSFN